jgi:uncharacterized membrane protein
MAFCANCGSEGKGKFCAKCGSPLPAEAAAQPTPPGYNPAQPSYNPPPPNPGYAPPNPGYQQPPGGYQQPQGGYQPPPGGQQYQQGYAPPPPAAAAGSGLTENVAAMLCYPLGVLTGVLFLVLEPHNKNRTVRFHAFQSIFLWIAMVILWIAVVIFTGILVFVPVLGRLVALVFPLFGLGSLALVAMLMYKAYNNEKWVLPLIGPMAEKQA